MSHRHRQSHRQWLEDLRERAESGDECARIRRRRIEQHHLTNRLMRMAKSNQIARATRSASGAVLKELNRIPLVPEFGGDEALLTQLPVLADTQTRHTNPTRHNWPTKQPD